MSKDLGLTNQLGWQIWYNPTDSPEGAYLGTLLGTQSSLVGNIPLGKTLQPGAYFVAFKIFDYKASGILDLVMGGTSLRLTNLNSADFNGWWTFPAAVSVVTPSSSLQITLQRTKALGVSQLYLLKGLYITTAAGEIVYADDSIVNLKYPTALDTSAPIKGNILENSSFEVGTGHGWGLREGASRDFTVRSLWDNTVGFDGTASLKVPRLVDLVSKPYHLRPNRQYTLSAWVKGTFQGSVTLKIENVSTTPSGYPAPVSLTQTFTTGSGWQRVVLSGNLLDYPTSDYQIRITGNDPQGIYTWVDGVQLEEGALTTYAPKTAAEVGLLSDKASSLFFEDEPATMWLRVRNSSAANLSVRIPYEIYDYLNRKIAAGSTTLVAPANGTWAGTLDLSTSQRGVFRVVLWIEGVDNTLEEVAYAVVPHPQQMAVDTNSIMGIHAEFTDFQFGILQELGVKWNRTTSPSRAFRWSAVEPSNGVFQWSSEDMTKPGAYGLTVMGTIGQDWPAWADNAGRPDLIKWETFVETVVGHYKNQVKYWEIWNEPQYTFPADFYAQLLQSAISAARRADPQAQIVGLGGVADVSWSTNVLNYLGSTWLPYLNSVSTHLYPKVSVPTYGNFRDVRDRYNLPVWNTESGVWDRGYYTGGNSDFLQIGYVWPHKESERYQYGSKGAAEVLASCLLHTVGNGLTKYFYYDSRIYVGPAYGSTHSTIFEYDDTIRAKGIAYAIFAKLLDHSTGLGNISPNSNSYMYLFDRGGTPLVGIWSGDRTNRSLTLNLASSQYRVYDMMGNPVSLVAGAIPFGAAPIYVEGQGILTSALRTAVQSGVVAARADTIAPNLSLVVFPTGPTTANPVKFRWLAVDDTSSPSASEPNGVLYSWMLQGIDGAWSPWQAGAHADYYNLPQGSYTFQVKSKDAAGNVSGVVQVAVQVGQGATTPPPAAPTSLLASAGDARVTLSWQASSGAASYTLNRGLVSGGPYTVVGSGITATSYADSTVLNGTTYFYVVSAVNVSGQSANSNEANASPQVFAPAAPVNLVATAGNGQVTLSWQVSSGANSYVVKRGLISGGPYTVIASGVTLSRYTDIEVLNGTAYFYVVSAVNAVGGSPNSNQAIATPQGPPAAPAGLTAGAGNAQVTSSWQASSQAQSYKVKRAAGSGGPYTIIATGVTATTYTDTTVQNGTTYYYVVSAVNTAGESPNSIEASATSQVPTPAAPTQLVATSGSSSQLNLSWADNASNEDGYGIARSSGGSAFTVVATVGANVTYYSDSGLSLGIAYTYRVWAYNVGGLSAAAQTTATTSSAVPSPLAAYSFDEGAGLFVSDSTTNGLDGSIVGGALWVGGLTGSALWFDGRNDSVKVPSVPALNFARNESFTLTAWVRTAPHYAKTGMIVGKAGSFSRAGVALMQLNNYNSYLYARLMDTDGDQTGYLANMNGPYVNDGNWHHVAMVVDRTQQQLVLYTDGIKSAPYSLATLGIDGIGDLANNDAFTIGGGLSPYQGTIDDVQVYDVSLDDAQINQIYHLF